MTEIWRFEHWENSFSGQPSGRERLVVTRIHTYISFTTYYTLVPSCASVVCSFTRCRSLLLSFVFSIFLKNNTETCFLNERSTWNSMILKNHQNLLFFDMFGKLLLLHIFWNNQTHRLHDIEKSLKILVFYMIKHLQSFDDFKNSSKLYIFQIQSNKWNFMIL